MILSDLQRVPAGPPFVEACHERRASKRIRTNCRSDRAIEVLHHLP
jgi:hypothetical protein